MEQEVGDGVQSYRDQAFVPAKPYQDGIAALPWLLELWKESLLFTVMSWSQIAAFEPS